jgi:multicomponent Na+:H+ antiporter subunit G
MIDWIVFIFLITGALFILISAIGILRLPDLFMRMHATTKTNSIGIALILVGTMMAFPQVTNVLKGLMIIIFIYLTSPLGAHMIGKAGLITNVKKWKGNARDDFTKE